MTLDVAWHFLCHANVTEVSHISQTDAIRSISKRIVGEIEAGVNEETNKPS